jgi:flagellin
LSGVAPGTYSLTYNETGTIGAATNLSLPATIATGEAAAVTYAGVTLTGGAAGVTAPSVDIAVNSSGNITGYTVNSAGSGFKAGDVLGVAARQEIVTAKFTDLAVGQTFTFAGIQVTGATATVTAANVASAFASLAAGASANAVTNLSYSGTLDAAYSTGARSTTTVTNDTVTFTRTASGRADDLAVTGTNASTVTRTVTQQGMNALTGIVVGKDIGTPSGSNKTLTMSGTINGLATTQSLAVSDNAALATQTFNFTSFGAQFDVKSYQGQTATQIGTAIATLNGLGGTASFGNPGQLIVAQGNNSALKFQSGANSDAFIQVDTINVQTGTSGTYAGTASAMTTLGDRISKSGVGNLGSLGVLDTIDTWQTAFKNSAAAVDNALEYISTQRAVYGSQMNRLSYISTNLQAQSTNLQNSRSSIIDTDFAAETARLTKGQIMQQAATAMLAQANQMPNVILSLLK